MRKIKSVKIAMAVTAFLLVVLIALAIALPWIVTWYVEKMGREPILPTIIMVSCYPCVPFAAAALIYLLKLLRLIVKGEVKSSKTDRCLLRIMGSCLVITVITLVAGRFYKPFLLVGVSFAFISLLTFTFKTILSHYED